VDPPLSGSSPNSTGNVAATAWQEEPFRRLVDSVTDYAIFLLDTEGNVASWNRGAQRLKGYLPAEIIGKHFSTFYPKSALDKGWPQHELDTARRLGRFEDEGWRLRKDGTRFWASVVITPVRDDAGRLLGFAKVTRDLTERRQNEERLRQSEERSRMLIEGVQDYAIFLVDVDGKVSSWNAGAERIQGYKPAEIIGKHISTFYPQEALDRDWPARELESAARLGRFEDEGWRLRKDGTRFWANVVITSLRGADGRLRGFSKITRDLSERREHEERLRQSEERFRLLLEGIADYAIFMLDAEGRVTSWNTGAERITGYAAEEVIGQSFERFFTPEDIAAARPAEELRRAVLHRRATDRGWRMRNDGTRYWADVIVTSLHDSDGRLRGFTTVTRDLSERKRMESLEAEGRQLTEFLAMLAHELRNPLAPIRNAAGIIGMQKDASRETLWARDVIERQSAQLTRLVDDLLDVSRITRGKLRLKGAPMDLNEALHRAIETVQPQIEARRQALQLTLSPKPLAVHGDLARLTQVVANLLGNASKYTQEGGEIRVTTEERGGDALLSVRDNGVGIAPHVLERVFDLFAQGERTLERSEGGLGIGLTLARRIVQLHGGAIKAKSEGPGKGSEFTVSLPRLTLEQGEASGPTGEFELPTGMAPRSILVVDDNIDAAASMAMLLRLAGHAVTIAHEGNAALESASRQAPDVLLLDIGLPGMDGYEVARHLRARPEGRGVRIIALTGYGQEEDRRRSMEAGFDGHLVKPVMPVDLFSVIDASPSSPSSEV
jgi:PAS domain S-box-containing protein